MGFAPAIEPQQLGALEWLDRIEVTGSAATTVTFSSTGDGVKKYDVDGDRDGTYLIKFRHLKGAVGTIELRPNGLTTNLSSELMNSNAATVAGASSSTWEFAGSAGAFDRHTGTVRIEARTGIPRSMWVAKTDMDVGAGDVRHGSISGMWDETSTNITSLEITGVASGLAVGTVFDLYRIREDAPALPLGAMEFLDRIDVGSDSTTVEFSGTSLDSDFQHDLNGDEDEYYYCRFRLVTDATGAEAFNVLPNGVNTNQDGNGLFSDGAGNSDNFTVARLRIGTGQNKAIELNGGFWLEGRTGRGVRTFLAEWASFDTTSFNVDAADWFNGGWNENSTLLSSITIEGATNRIKSGSSFELFRIRSRPTPRVAEVSVASELWVPPETASPFDDEFTSDVLLSKWTLQPAASAASIDPYANFASGGPRISVNRTRRSWLAVQPETNIATQNMLTQPHTLPTNCYIWTRLSTWDRAAPINNNEVGAGLIFSADNNTRLNDSVIFWFETDASAYNAQFDKYESTTLTIIDTVASESEDVPWTYFLLQKRGSVFDAWLLSEGGAKMHVNSTTYAGGTLDNMGLIWMHDNQAGPGNPIIGNDFFRYSEGIYIPV